MRIHKPETQTLYAQLYETTAAYELELLGGFANGFVTERRVRNRKYLYWQLRDVAGHLRQVYLGPKDNERTLLLSARLVEAKGKRAPILEDLQRLTAAYVASGGAHHQRAHFKIVDALARSGMFRSGALLVGSHAFVSIGAALGVSWSANTIATADIDLVRDEFVSIACEDREPVDVPAALRSVDPSFFLVPELDLKTPSSSLQSRVKGVRVDLLTTARTPRDTKSRAVAPYGLAARPLRYMDYLIREDVQRGLFIGPHAVMVDVPHAGRFALHKLAVAAQRQIAAKADKDRRQASALILALAEIQPGALAHAMAAAARHHDRGLLRDVRRTLARLPAEVKRAAP